MFCMLSYDKLICMDSKKEIMHDIIDNVSLWNIPTDTLITKTQKIGLRIYKSHNISTKITLLRSNP